MSKRIIPVLSKPAAFSTAALLSLCTALAGFAAERLEPMPPVQAARPEADAAGDLSIAVDAASVERRITESVRYLAGDELEGRGLEGQGILEAANYIANEFAAAGLKVDLWDGKPYQSFNVDSMVRASDASANWLQISTDQASSGATEGADAQRLMLDEDFRPLAVGGSHRYVGPVVFAGYGITASGFDPQGQRWEYDDYAGLDVAGKAVLILRKEPQQADESSVFDGTRTTEHAYFSRKFANAVGHGAAAVFFVNDSISVAGGGADADVLPQPEVAGDLQPGTTIPCVFLTRKSAERLLAAGHSAASLDELEAAIDRTLQPQSRPLPGLSVDAKTELITQMIRAYNVVGVLEGRGALAAEAVLIGAHYDHVGMGGPGSLSGDVVAVHNGADDNASGTAALIELARQMAAERRSSHGDCRRVIFAAFSGEERGLLGSKHYVEHSIGPLSSLNAMVNLDMIGRLGEEVIVYGIGSSPDFASLILRSSAAAGVQANLQSAAYGPSDHRPFFERRVPVLHFFTGIHPEYHRPADDFEKINTTGIVRITDMVYQAVGELATQPRKLAFVQAPGRANISIATREHGRLGVQLRADGQPVVVAAVEAGSPAEAAGLRVDDRIVAIDRSPIVSTDAMIEHLRGCSPKQRVRLSVQRDSASLEIPVELGH